MKKKTSIRFLFYFIQIVFLSYNAILYPQTNNLQFDHFSMEDGLPDDGFRCIAQDNLGFIWIGTRNGLVKYDGYDFVVYSHDDNDSNSIVGNVTRSIMIDSKGDLWIGTNSGLSILLREKDKFLNFPQAIEQFNNSEINLVKSIIEDSKGNVWLGRLLGEHNFVNKKFVQNKNKSMVFENIKLDYTYSGLDNIYEMLEDEKKFIWAATEAGLLKIDGQVIEIIQPFPGKELNNKNNFFAIAEDKENILWLGTYSDGIASYNKKSKIFNYYPYNIKKSEGQSNNKITLIFVDKSGKIWAAAKPNNSGLLLFDRAEKKYQRYLNNPYDPNSISSDDNSKNAIIQDHIGNIWLGIGEDKLNKINIVRNSFKYYRNYSTNKDDIEFDKFTTPLEAHDGKIWFVARNGLFQYLCDEEKFIKVIPKGKSKTSSLSGSYKSIAEDFQGKLWTAGKQVRIYNPQKKYLNCIESSIFEKVPSPYFVLVDKDNIVWIANWGSGLDRYNPKTKTIRNYSFDPNNKYSISNDFITKICADSSNGIWIATNDGNLNKLNKVSGKIKRFNIAKYTGYIDRVYTDSKNRVWAGTLRGGILLFDTKTDNFKRITKSEGMPSNSYINGFTEDEFGNIYCCSPNYLIKFNENAEIESYFKFGRDGEFLHNTTFIKKTRELFVVSDKGFYRFHIDSLRKNNTPPKMVLTSLRIHNNPIYPGISAPLNKHINLAKELILNYDMNEITIEYAGLHFVNPKEQNYKYMLENYDNSWREVGNLRRAEYANLEYGEYIFKVLGSNSDGVWATEPATLSIVILPPWWLTWWAYLIYTVIILSILTYTYVLQKKRLRVKHEIEMKSFEAAKLNEVDQMKSKFFANISHEFRTPLTLIKTPVERLLEKEKSDDTKTIYKMILRNSERLLGLINELFDLSKLESGIMKLSAQKSDIVSFVKGIAMSFESLAQKKNIQLSNNSALEIIELYFDKEKVQKIIGNLLLNAIKFTQEKGLIEINISCKTLEQNVEITISDNGIGIPKDELPKIFDRFYQVNRHKKEGNLGAGIGLSLSKELIEMHHGFIKVSSEVNIGTTFILSFPMGNKHLKEDEIIFDEFSDQVEESKRAKSEIESPIVGKPRSLVLIIEDNIDVQNLIKETIEKKYTPILANDGKEGYEKAIKHTPDLIISDIMMPKETGDKMCEKLKKNNITSHIPIILLTAKASGVDKISGLETGADDYLVKPFNDKELLARIKNLITQRQKLREKYLREAEIHPTEVAVTSIDKKFIENVIKIVEENMHNSEFRIEHFAEDLAMSRAQLYRKFNSILGEKPSDFVRRFRIIRAAELIKKHYGNIAQTAYEVGFNNLSYFSKCFKHIYQVSPHEYQKKHQKTESK